MLQLKVCLKVFEDEHRIMLVWFGLVLFFVPFFHNGLLSLPKGTNKYTQKKMLWYACKYYSFSQVQFGPCKSTNTRN